MILVVYILIIINKAEMFLRHNSTSTQMNRTTTNNSSCDILRSSFDLITTTQTNANVRKHVCFNDTTVHLDYIFLMSHNKDETNSQYNY